MFINFTNHRLPDWSREQIETAEKEWGTLAELPFPEVDPRGSKDYISQLATEYVQRMEAMLAQSAEARHAVHVMGEMTLCFEVVTRLKAKGIHSVVATTRRTILHQKDGIKTNKFEFVQFRSY